MSITLIKLENVVPEIFNSPFKKSITWQLNFGEVWTITGPNGSGKSMLADVICGKYQLLDGKIDYSFQNCKEPTPADCIKLINFTTVFSLADYRNAYYQLRFNNPEEEVAPFISKLFPEAALNQSLVTDLFELLDITKLIDRRLVQLSSGELRKFLIARFLIGEPKVLIFDNPFVGLDFASRKHLNEIFPILKSNSIGLIFLIPEGSEIPEGTTHLLEMLEGENISESKFVKNQPATKPGRPKNNPQIDWTKLPRYKNTRYTEIVKMENIEISYNNRVICSNINWTIQKGEKWALLGPNGSGKSTLLSYICADNPRSYIEGLSLFENKRGSGESIWDIKQRIGFTSSEMHLYYRKKSTCRQVIESGLYDSVGLYHTTYGEERQIAEYVMQCLSIEHLKDRLFLEVSSGEQRMVLFARAIIKNPELLVLDEPFHGMDSSNKNICKAVVDSYCSQPGKTLVFVTHEKEEIPQCVDHYFELPGNIIR